MTDKKNGLSDSFARLLQKREVERWRYIAGEETRATLHLIALEFQLKWAQFKTNLKSKFNQEVAGTNTVSTTELKKTEQRHLTRLFNSYAAKSWGDIARRLNKTRSSISAWQSDTDAGQLQDAKQALEALTKQARAEAEEIVDMTEGKNRYNSTYDAILDLQTPGLTTDIFESLAEKVIQFHKTYSGQLTAPQTKARSESAAENIWAMNLDKQRRLFHLIMNKMGFDPARGQTGETDHPATLGMHNDVRVGMRYNKDDFLEGVLTAFHEGGHALYRQGLPHNLQNTLSGQISGVAIDEAMALLMENHVARSRAGAEWIYQMVCEIDPSKKHKLSADDIYQKSIERSVQPLRTSADEIRYPLDVILRFRIERDMFNTDFDFETLDDRWKQDYLALTGQTIQDGRHGALQDIHWFADEFGWFPNYMLGQLAAAQIFEAATTQAPHIRADIQKGHLRSLTDWLSQNIYSQGARYDAFDLIENATGKPLDTKPWETHIKNRFLPLRTADPVPKNRI